MALKSKLSQITKVTFKEALFLAYKDGITSLAPLGFSGNTIKLYECESKEISRCSQVSIRNYCGDAELLITDKAGNFLFYGRYRIDLGINFVLDQYWEMFNKVKDKIELEIKRKSIFKDIEIPKDVERTIGFDLLEAYQLSMI